MSKKATKVNFDWLIDLIQYFWLPSRVRMFNGDHFGKKTKANFDDAEAINFDQGKLRENCHFCSKRHSYTRESLKSEFTHTQSSFVTNTCHKPEVNLTLTNAIASDKWTTKFWKQNQVWLSSEKDTFQEEKEDDDDGRLTNLIKKSDQFRRIWLKNQIKSKILICAIFSRRLGVMKDGVVPLIGYLKDF